jgi:DNA repair exonuclease SbcCD ATPase subunit
MSRNAFNECEREYNRNEELREINRDERSLDKKLFEQLKRDAIADALRVDREQNGLTPLEIAQMKIKALEQERAETHHEIIEWLRDLREYLPEATSLAGAILGIEKLEKQRDDLRQALQNLMQSAPTNNVPDCIFLGCIKALDDSKTKEKS